jgi:predicted chitinase
LNAVSFDALPAGYLAADWRFHPREFFGQMRKCGWLSSTELPQVVIRKTRGTPRIPISWAQARTRIVPFGTHINFTFRKFVFETRLRQSHFFGQCVQETDYLQTMGEYGASTLDYAPYSGRGFTQLTWAKNYVSYGKFRGFSAPTTFNAANFPAWHARYRNNWYDGRPSAAQLQQHGRAQYILDGKSVPSWDVESLISDAFMSVDSGGFYWVWKALADSNTGRRTGHQGIIRLADSGFSQTDIDEVTYNINGGWNGRDIRRLTSPYAWAVLNDEVLPIGFERQVP